MLTDAELQDLLFRYASGFSNWRDRERLRAHIQAQAELIAALKQDLAERDAEIARLSAPGADWPVITVEVRAGPVMADVAGQDAQAVWYANARKGWTGDGAGAEVQP